MSFTTEAVQETELESGSKLISCLDENISLATLTCEFNTILSLLSCIILQVDIDECIACFF